jgi:ABC-type cobalt transport system substrate-binding protein
MKVQNLKKAISPRVVFMAVVITLVITTVADSQQYPLADQVAAKVIEKYQNMSCEQLAQSKQTPPSGQQAAMMQKAVQQLKQDPAMRTAFINKVAPPIANKMFDCGMIP